MAEPEAVVVALLRFDVILGAALPRFGPSLFVNLFDTNPNVYGFGAFVCELDLVAVGRAAFVDEASGRDIYAVCPSYGIAGSSDRLWRGSVDE